MHFKEYVSFKSHCHDNIPLEYEGTNLGHPVDCRVSIINYELNVKDLVEWDRRELLRESITTFKGSGTTT